MPGDDQPRYSYQSRQEPQHAPPLVGSRQEDGAWEDIDRTLTFGYVGPDGKWVPGILENIRDIQDSCKAIIARADRSEEKQRVVDRWTIRVILLIVMLRFIGVESITGIAKLWGLHV